MKSSHNRAINITIAKWIMNDFAQEVKDRIKANSVDERLQGDARALLLSSIAAKYSYNMTWLSRPIIQYPQDMVALQELVWQIRPDLIIETGIAHGGSLILSASMLALLDYCDAAESGQALDPRATRRRVLGIDIDIRRHNRAAIEKHPLAHKIDMVEGSSIDADTIARVREIAKPYKRILLCLDSNHTHAHVLAELEAYAPLVSRDSYCVVFDTVVEDLPDELFPDRPWGKGDNPKTAVWEYFRRLKQEGRAAVDGAPLNFEIDKSIEHRLLITVAPDGYLKRI
jgi:cephalosporin hydroxylase